MAAFSNASEKRVQELHVDLAAIIREAILITDFAVVEGYRGKEVQDSYFKSGMSKLKWPESKHNKNPSLAVDIAPYPIDWKKKERFFFLAGVIKAIAHNRGIKIRWGGDWDGDGDYADQTFQDLVHYELVQVCNE